MNNPQSRFIISCLKTYPYYYTLDIKKLKAYEI